MNRLSIVLSFYKSKFKRKTLFGFLNANGNLIIKNTKTNKNIKKSGKIMVVKLYPSLLG